VLLDQSRQGTRFEIWDHAHPDATGGVFSLF
jgi:hypothetical protein